MTRLSTADLPPSEFSRIFGAKDDAGTGRSRMCKVCGGWHSLERPWPHNCRSERPPRSHLASPQLAPRFDEFVTGKHDDPVIINDRRDKREYMARNELVEFDAGVTSEPPPTDRQWREEFAADFKRMVETDPLNRPPVDVLGQTDTEEAGEIDATDIEVFK